MDCSDEKEILDDIVVLECVICNTKAHERVHKVVEKIRTMVGKY